MSKKTVIVTIDRWLGGATAGCHGIAVYKHAGKSSMSGLSLQDIVGEALPRGTVLHVTVEVIKRGKPTPKDCENPWPSHVCSPRKRG